ncbi:hypothetical protein PCANC_27140 [Puccinia coronata f. sp. avenae]|uniref:Uncharacterized protein n=1 Tax=Puccinia coronata f. sp. avenae TaxID=200324 RepID=A0A2N5S2Y1_9BASI|nr:hypothetical protein PCANC_27140 [Puccinia coronata f. sp. avenae]
MKRVPKLQAKETSNPHPNAESDNNGTCIGASHHMFSDKSRFSEYQERTTLIELANGNNLNSAGVKLKSVSEDLLLSAERDDVRMTLPFLY